MPEISKDYLNKPQIELTLTYDFIRKYHLEQLVNDIISPSSIISFDILGTFKIPFKFPNSNDYDEEFIKQFIELFEDELNQYQLVGHCDNLLFLANTYNKISNEKYTNVFKENKYRAWGKLLFNLIKAPLPKYTLETIGKAFEDDELSPEEIEDYLLMYLGVESKLRECTFKDADGKLDYGKITKDQQYSLIRRVLADKNISIKMPNGNYLIISKDVSAVFSYKGQNETCYFSAEDGQQNNTIIERIIKSLFDEQEKENPEFYQAVIATT